MAYIIQETEQPKKSLHIKRIKFHLPQTDFISLVIVLCLLANIVSLLVLKQQDPTLEGISIGLLLYALLKREEKEQEKENKPVAKQGKVQVVNAPNL